MPYDHIQRDFERVRDQKRKEVRAVEAARTANKPSRRK